MTATILPGLLNNLVYPATLTIVGILGNAYILGNQIQKVDEKVQNVKDDLGDQIVEVKHDIKDMKHGIADLIARQNKMELHDMSVAEKLLKDCGKNKRG